MAEKRDIGQQITDTIRNYYALGSDTVDLDGILALSKTLSTLRYGFAIIVGENYAEKNASEFRRKSAFAAKYAEHMEKGLSGVRAGALANSEVMPLLREELTADAIYRKSFLILESSGEVLKCMSQHIAHLRKEKADETHARGSQ